MLQKHPDHVTHTITNPTHINQTPRVSVRSCVCVCVSVSVCVCVCVLYESRFIEVL